jgi:hypothetical protein
MHEHLTLPLSSQIDSTQLYLEGAIESILPLNKSQTLFTTIEHNSMTWREPFRCILHIFYCNILTSKYHLILYENHYNCLSENNSTSSQ